MSGDTLPAEAGSTVRSHTPPRERGRGRALRLLALFGALLLAGYLGLRWRERETRRVAGLHAARGMELRETGDREGALRELESAARMDPRNGHAWYLLGKAREEQKIGTGLPDLERAERLLPQSAEVLRDHGLALHEAGRIEEARTRLTRAAELAPTDQSVYAALGRAHVARVTSPEDLKRGVEAFRTALTLQPGDVQSRFRLARALHQAEELEAARREFVTTLSLLAAGGRASTTLMDGRTMDSVTWLSLVKGCHHHLGQILTRQKQPELARRHQRIFDDMGKYIRETYTLFDALKANPKDAAAQRRLGDLYARFGLPRSGPDGPSAVRRWIGP